jgi:hypothetical protein
LGDMHRSLQAAFGAGLLIFLSGCPGTLSNPGDFTDGGMEVKDAEAILAESCGTTGCHDDTSQAQAGLDLVSPGVENRVVDVNAIGIGCSDRILVVAGDPNTSYLLDKILNVPGICGLQMPVVGTLPPEDIDILEEWIIDLGASSGSELDGG